MSLHLQSENYSLRLQLEGLLREARSNEDKMRRFDQLERQLIAASSLSELLRLLLVDYRQAFGIERVTLALVDPADEVMQALDGEMTAELSRDCLLLVRNPAAIADFFPSGERPWLGAYANRHAFLFPGEAAPPASVALLPMHRQGALFGSLQLGSASPERYDSACGTDFLERLVAILAVCIENALVRERLKQVGLTDGLTGVHNRRYFEHRCQVEISQARRYRHPLACMFLDIDRFKRINDTHGHQTGDAVLRSVAAAVQGQLRAGDTIARYGGEEFVILLPQTAVHHAKEIAERIRAGIAARHFEAVSGHELAVTLSVGLAMLPADKPGDSPAVVAEQLVAAADKALYQAKHTGRNRVVCSPDAAGEAVAPWSVVFGRKMARTFGTQVSKGLRWLRATDSRRLNQA